MQSLAVKHANQALTKEEVFVVIVQVRRQKNESIYDKLAQKDAGVDGTNN